VEEGADASFLDLLRERVCRQVVNFLVINFLAMIDFVSLDRKCGKGASAWPFLCFFGVSACLRVVVDLVVQQYTWIVLSA
jgi:hypothetical protein